MWSDVYGRDLEISSSVADPGEHLRSWIDAPVFEFKGYKNRICAGGRRILIEIMPVMFIPAGVGLITAWGKLKTMLVPVGIITVVTTFLVMIVTGKVTEMMLKQKEKKQTEKMQTGEKEEQDGSGDL